MSIKTPNVAITDWTFSDLSIERECLESNQIAVCGKQCKTESDLVSLVSDADAVITQFAKINAQVIGAMKKCKVIIRYGIGVDNVDISSARSRNIPVCNIPDYCIDEVADHTVAFILAATRQVVPNTLHTHAGKWSLSVPLAAMRTLKELTVGVVGFGRIGREVAKRLLAFKCRLLVFDPVVSGTEIAKMGAGAASFDELLEQSDVITLHCPSTPQTRHMFNEETFSKLKPGAIFVNVGRGDLADSTALVEALRSGRLGAAALDVFDPEPIPGENPVLKMPNVILAAHVASASLSAVKRLRETAAKLAVLAIQCQPLPSVVNGVKA